MAPPKVTTLPGRPGAKPKVTTLPGGAGAKPKVKPLAKTDLPSTIDEYLHSRGSPMAGLGSSFVQAGRRYGVDPRLLVGIGVIESGAGKYTKHPHNFANWSVHEGKQYGSYEQAIDDLARGLRSGYISKGLNTPDKIVQRYAPGSDGNDTSRWASVVSEVMQTLGGNPARVGRRPQPQARVAGATPTRELASTRPPAAPPGPPRVSYKGGIDATALAQALIQGISPEEALRQATTPFQMIEHAAKVAAPKVPPPRPAAAAVDPKAPPPSAKNGLLQAPTSWSGTHVTDGLGWGTKTAEDIMAKPGTGVGAPESGTIEYFHPTGAQGGGSMLFHADSGHTYWLGHIADGLPGGTRVDRGQPIAVISGDHPRPHLHIDRR